MVDRHWSNNEQASDRPDLSIQLPSRCYRAVRKYVLLRSSGIVHKPPVDRELDRAWCFELPSWNLVGEACRLLQSLLND